MKVIIVVTFENCEIFSTYYFLYVQGYMAVMSGGSKIKDLNAEKIIQSFLKKNFWGVNYK